MIHRNRKRGTGSIRYNGGKWEAKTPQRGSTPGRSIARKDTRREAERALAEWLAENPPAEVRV